MKNDHLPRAAGVRGHDCQLPVYPHLLVRRLPVATTDLFDLLIVPSRDLRWTLFIVRKGGAELTNLTLSFPVA